MPTAIKLPAMAGTFTKILVHHIFSTKNRVPSIAPEVEAGLFKYMVGISKNMQCWVMAINGTPDHVHILASMSKHCTVIQYMEDMKKDSSKWMKHQGAPFAGFGWQEGYGAFTIGASGVPALKRYIARQKEHHRTVTFQEEFLTFLKKYGVPYDERYIWK